jgi:hypothetical protein
MLILLKRILRKDGRRIMRIFEVVGRRDGERLE